MPLYEYHCQKCDSTVEVLIRNEREKPECPDCGSLQLDKQLSVAAAPATAGARLPVAGTDAPTCGRDQCQSGCMFD